MDKKIIVTTIIVSLTILIVGGILVTSFEKRNQEREKNIKIPSKNSIVYYYGITCPHCKEVEEWMEKNKVDEKIKIEKKEVWENKNNALELKKVAEGCQLDSEIIGVPFLYADGKCYKGKLAVIKKLEEKLNSKEENGK